jgi:CHAD domain-containing protein
MMLSRKPPAAISGLSWFMLQRVPPLLDAFENEIGGVRIAEDIEYIHRMRVASRRLRAALPLFRSCFPAKQYGRWMAEIAGITRALGEARDADVQIAFLLKYLKKSLNAWNKRHKGEESEPPVAPALRYLLTDLRKRRAQYQDRVLSALDALEKSRVVPDLRETLLRIAATGHRIPRQGLAFGIPTLAAFRIESRLETLLSYEPWVSHADAVAEHHATRIAAKKLRYTMEIYGPVYRLGLAKPHARVKRIQEILGDLHDTDVWIDHITRVLLRERSRFRSDNEEKRPDTNVLASLKVFLQDREKERILLHRQFMRYWESLARSGLWDELRTTIVAGQKKRYVPAPVPRDEEIHLAVETFASRFTDVVGHERCVTRLALMLFDSLKSVHGLDDHDRVLLESSGMLHDIGWQGRRKNHHIRSTRIIITDETLPFTINDRMVIGLCAFFHRGRINPEQHPLFLLMSPALKEKTLRLASLLRIADGLDYPHQGNVEEVHCVIGSDTVTCDVISPADVTIEKEHARSKSDLFVLVFGRDLVIH